MYGGVGAETASTDAAVAATRGQVVTYQGKPVVTYFFSSSGGHTENVENVWPGAAPEPWLRGVPDPYDGAGHDPYHRWTHQLSLAAAAAKLGSWVKGDLVGIRVTKHGASPRILRAVVVGTKGTTTVTGPQLQHAFGLLTTYAAFTTIDSFAGRAPAHASAAVPGPADSEAMVALVPLVRDLVGAVAGLHGSVFPLDRGERLAIERRTRHGWRTVLHTRLAADGTYDTGLPGPGTYRVVVGGLAGPAVTVG
jgi:stage II sporulation protein D